MTVPSNATPNATSLPAQCVHRERLWVRSLAWLLFLGPFFFITYGFASTWTAQQPDVGSFVFDWERAAFPFVPMLILPYMSIDMFYALSLFLVRSKTELDTHARRLLLATIVSVTCFFIFPLQFTFTRPPVEGFNGFLLDLLTGFDKPFNQAPSLHISLLILLWIHFSRRCTGAVMAAMHVWFALIGVSVLLVWQHHFIDVIGGIVVGFGVWYLLPDSAVRFRWSRQSVHPGKALCYWSGSLGLTLAAVAAGDLLWLLTWPAVSCGIVAAGYSGFGASVFQKNEAGSRALAATVLLVPYLFIAHFSRMFYTRGEQRRVIRSVGGLTLVAWPGPRAGAPAVLDLCAEFTRDRVFARYVSIPMQDLVFPTTQELDAAIEALNSLTTLGTVHVHCALGRGRSALVAAAWLLESRQVQSVAAAVADIRNACPLAHVSAASERALADWWHER